MFLDTRKFNFSLNSVLKKISHYLLIGIRVWIGSCFPNYYYNLSEDEFVACISWYYCFCIQFLPIFKLNEMRWYTFKELFFLQCCLCYFGAYLAVWEYCTPGLNTHSQCCFFSCFNAPATTVIIILWAVSIAWLVLLYIRLCQNLHLSS